MAQARQKGGFGERAFDFFDSHADEFEDFHGLSAEKTVLYAIYFRKCAFADEAFDRVCGPDYFPVLQKAHALQRNWSSGVANSPVWKRAR
jgi:hypothetical protein